MKKYVAPKLRSPIKMHGGKSYLCRRIISLFPWHETYVEVFAGGLSVLLNKKPSNIEIANDVNIHLINMWRELQQASDDKHPRVYPFSKNLNGMLLSTAYSLDTWLDAGRALDLLPPQMAAWCFLCRNRMSRGGLGKTFAWSDRLRGKRSESGPVPGELNSWATFLGNDLPRIISRVSEVTFLREDWRQVLDKYACKSKTLLYLDPPYFPSARTAKKAYGPHEMTPDDHGELVTRLAHDTSAKWFLSGYDCPLYRSVLKGLPCHTWSMPNHSGQGKTKQRRVECLWTNFEHVSFKQLDMFSDDEREPEP